MAKWQLHEIRKAVCDECGDEAACNVYRTPHGCICLACREIRPKKVYEFFNVCGSCMGKWLKSREQFEDVDYGD